MNHTQIPLDIAFINESGIIESIKELKPLNPVPVYSDAEVLYALEVNSGWFTENNVNVGDQIIVRNAQSSTNSDGVENKGYNGTFLVAEIKNDKEFRYSNVDTAGVTHTTGTFTNNTQTRSTLLPRFDRNNNSGNFFDVRTDSTSSNLVFYCPLEEDGTELINGNDLTITGATFTSIG